MQAHHTLNLHIHHNTDISETPLLISQKREHIVNFVEQYSMACDDSASGCD